MVLLVIKKNRPAWQGALLGALALVLGIVVVTMLGRKLMGRKGPVATAEAPEPGDRNGSVSSIAPEEAEDARRVRSSVPSRAVGAGS